MTATPHLATLHVWRVVPAGVPAAMWRMAVDRRRLRAMPGVGFAKLLGTSAGHTFAASEADPTRYAALIAWTDPAAADRFDSSPVARDWDRITRTGARLDLVPLHSRGRWSGQEPFGTPPPDGGPEGPVLALTRARLRPGRAVRFWRAIPAVAAAARDAPGLLARFGIGEAPIGWQGTVTVWRDPARLRDFAYRHPQHRAAIDRTPVERWYAEELFARFAVRDIRGDRAVLGWTEEAPRR